MLETVIPFIIECEKLKSVLRRTKVVGTDRRENSAEHSWSLALLAIGLFPHMPASLDQLRVLKMVILHDIVEIDAGDTFCYAARLDKAECEQAAADRIFALLSPELGMEFMAIWHEFEAGETPEAAFANALDRMLPLIQNLNNNGQSWREHGVTWKQVMERNVVIAKSSPALWQEVEAMLHAAAGKGILPHGGAF
ncbi:HD domain-containing protein [Luteolibacter sp. SL250]|uniref:HD domain-containing protein n=1 Tax=Luteolibacter sp. SL250 TaxID=2995170 RepID=UPI00226DE963|nr:HD domain-containing protein [Luteolibacter sp. SL250]WAC21578.1 HD domain-containing protein [Luteolibacter sp. SL250]